MREDRVLEIDIIIFGIDAREGKREKKSADFV
jgi:hypothetical protein